MGADLELFYASCHPERSEESLCNTLSLALSYRTDVRYLYILRSLVVALYCGDSTVILNITSVWLVILSMVKDLKKRFFVTLRMTYAVRFLTPFPQTCSFLLYTQGKPNLPANPQTPCWQEYRP